MAVAGLAVSRWLLLGLLAAVLQAATINLNWTIAGVQNYTDYPLMVMIGDSINFMCDPDIISNFIYVETEEQYTSCNSTATDGCTIMSGDCLASFSPADMFSQSIQRFSGSSHCSVVEYRPNRLYYFYSSSTGELSTATDGPPFIGGQCSDGLKMKVFVLDVPTSSASVVLSPTPSPTGQPKDSGKSGGTGNSPSTGDNLFIILGSILGALGFVGLVAFAGVICYCCFCKNRNSEDIWKDEERGIVLTPTTEPEVQSGSGSPDNGSTKVAVESKNKKPLKPVRKAPNSPVKEPTLNLEEVKPKGHIKPPPNPPSIQPKMTKAAKLRIASASNRRNVNSVSPASSLTSNSPQEPSGSSVGARRNAPNTHTANKNIHTNTPQASDVASSSTFHAEKASIPPASSTHVKEERKPNITDIGRWY